MTQKHKHPMHENNTRKLREVWSGSHCEEDKHQMPKFTQILPLHIKMHNDKIDKNFHIEPSSLALVAIFSQALAQATLSQATGEQDRKSPSLGYARKPSVWWRSPPGVKHTDNSFKWQSGNPRMWWRSPPGERVPKVSLSWHAGNLRMWCRASSRGKGEN